MSSGARRLLARQLTDVCTVHGEGPVWDAAAGVLRWVDMLAGDILATALPPGKAEAGRIHTGEIERLHVGSVAAALRPRDGGGLGVAVERGFALLDPDSSTPRYLGDLWSDPSVRMNDGGCDPQGRFYCGSMAYDETPGRASLYRLDPDLTVTSVLDGVTISNGLVWSLDGGTAYYVDTPTARIDAFAFDASSGRFGERRTAVDIPTAVGAPDGLTVDAEGALWVALWGGGAVHRYGPDGQLDTVVELPVRQVTACTFAGPNLDLLCITTSRHGVPAGEQPTAGALYWVRPGVPGLPARTFAG
jgi:sugar lactone lactonase YvrE